METKHLRLDKKSLDQIKSAGATGFEINARFPYTPKVFKEKDDKDKYLIPKTKWTVYILKSKSGIDLAKDDDNVGGYEIDYINKIYRVTDPKMGSQRIKTLQLGLWGIRRQYMEDGDVLISWDREDGKDVGPAKLLTTEGKTDKIIESDMSIDDIIRRLPTSSRKSITMMEAVSGASILSGIQTELESAINERSVMTEEELRGLEF